MTFEIVVNALGGLALFLLAMQMMTEGLTVFAGTGLKKLLGRWTSTPLRGVFAGVLVTGLVQSSSAVTVATIGFVNAGVLTMRQALGVIFGTNVGTSMTGWLVSIVGFGFKIDSFALPILTIGVITKLVVPSRRWTGFGESLAGFGLFFLGLSILKDAFGGLATAYSASVASGQEAGGILTFVVIGFVATVLTQSSSAAIAIILTAAAGNVVGLEQAAAAVVGANLGTTSTAAVAVFKATPSARRLALGHILFNVITGVVALLILPFLMTIISYLSGNGDAQKSPATALAMFHSVFNILGVCIMLPLASRLATWLETLFRSEDEDIGCPKHLDTTLKSTPAMAVLALNEELVRLSEISREIARSALLPGKPDEEIEKKSYAVRNLGSAITDYVGEVRTEFMPEDVANDLAATLYISRHFQEVARLAPAMRVLTHHSRRLADKYPGPLLQAVLDAADESFKPENFSEAVSDSEFQKNPVLINLWRAYKDAQKGVLDATVKGALPIDATENLLVALHSTRRAVEQLTQGCSRLNRNRRENVFTGDSTNEEAPEKENGLAG